MVFERGVSGTKKKTTTTTTAPKTTTTKTSTTKTYTSQQKKQLQSQGAELPKQAVEETKVVTEEQPKHVTSVTGEYSPFEQAVSKKSPELAQSLYIERTGTTPEKTHEVIVEKKPEKTVTEIISGYTPLEQAVAETKPEVAKELYEQRTGVSTIDLKKILSTEMPEGAHQHEPGGPIEVATVEENALYNAERTIPPTIAHEHGVQLHDIDYGAETSRLEADIIVGQQALQAEKDWLADYKIYEEGINKNIATIKAGPQDAQWEIDLNNDNKIDSNEIFTSQQAVQFFQKELTSARTTKAEVEKSIPLLQSDINAMRESKIYLEEYQRKGYYLNVKEGEYSFSAPKASEVVQEIYGDRPDLYIAQELRTLGVGLLFAGTQQLITGQPSLEAEKESSAESILGATRKPGESIESHATRFWTSPEVFMDVYVPIATFGVSKGIALVGSKLAPTVISAGSKIARGTGATGTKIISGLKTVSTGAGKLLSNQAVQYGMKYGLYGALEAPALIETAQKEPEMFGSELGKSLFRWEVAWTAMDIGFQTKPIKGLGKTEESVFVGQPVTDDLYMRDIQKKVETGAPQVFVKGERNIGEFNIRPKYAPGALESEPMGELKLYEFRGFDTTVAGQPKTTFTGYLLTSDKPMVAQVGQQMEFQFGELSTRLHPSLKPGQEVFVSEERSFIFGTSATKIEKAGVLVKEEKTIFSEFTGVSQRPQDIPFYFKSNQLLEPGVQSEYYISDLTLIPRGREAMNVKGMGLSKSGYEGLYSEIGKEGKITVTRGTKAETEFVGEIGPRVGPEYNISYVKERGNIFSKTNATEGKGLFSEERMGGEISVRQPTQMVSFQKTEGVTVKIQKGLSGGSGALRLAEKETSGQVSKLILKQEEKGIMRTVGREGEISLLKSSEKMLSKETASLSMKAQRTLSGGAGALARLGEKEAVQLASKTGRKTISTAIKAGTLIGKTAEMELLTTVKKQGAIEQQRESRITETLTLTKPIQRGQQRQRTSPRFISGLSSVSITQQGEVDTEDEKRFTGELFVGGQLYEPVTGEEEEPATDTYQVGGLSEDTLQNLDQRLGSLTKVDLLTEYKTDTLISPPSPTIHTPRIITPRPPRPRRRKHDEGEEPYGYELLTAGEEMPLRKKRRKKGLIADWLSVTSSQAKYGKATQPRLTKELWSESEKTMFLRTPTEELIKGTKQNNMRLLKDNKKKGGKKNVYY